MRQSIIDMVLATEMSKHFVHVNKFQSVFSKVYDEGAGVAAGGEQSGGSDRSSPDAASPDAAAVAAADPDMITLTEGPPVTPENVAILKRMMIKCADISNPARPLGICKEWAFRIAEEYFSQVLRP